jgi:hypothetical protein
MLVALTPACLYPRPSFPCIEVFSMLLFLVGRHNVSQRVGAAIYLPQFHSIAPGYR